MCSARSCIWKLFAAHPAHCHKPVRPLLVLIEEVVRVLVEHHAADRLQGEDVWPGVGVIHRVKVKLVLVSQLPEQLLLQERSLNNTKCAGLLCA